MKRLFVALLPLLAACSSSPASNGGGGKDGGTPVTGQDAGMLEDSSIPPSKDGGTKDSGTVSSGDAGSGDGKAACSAWATAFCTQLSTCSSFGLGAAYGTEAVCVARMTISCNAGLAAPGTSNTPASTQACATAISAASCTSLLGGTIGACATLAGSVAASGACSFDAQCATKFCAIPPGSVCGTCATPTTVGGACVSGACSSGTFCDPKTTKCVAGNSVANGGSCDILQQCDLAAGTACNPTDNTCDLPVTVASPGGSCGATLSGLTSISSAAVCPGSGSCSAEIAPGTCSPAAADGTACNPDGGVGCMPPAVCVSGTCTLPGAKTCP